MKPALLATILGTVCLSAVAQVALKIGTRALSSSAGKELPAIILSVASSPFIWLGLGIYGASVLAWLWVLSKTDVSVAYPFVGISFVLTARHSPAEIDHAVACLVKVISRMMRRRKGAKGNGDTTQLTGQPVQYEFTGGRGIRRTGSILEAPSKI